MSRRDPNRAPQKKRPRIPWGCGGVVLGRRGGRGYLAYSTTLTSRRRWTLIWPGVLQFVLDPLGDLPGQQDHFVLADHLGFDDDADLAAGLDGVGLLHPRKEEVTSSSFSRRLM